nr:MAG: hypothetical protein DIU59_10275 [Pseudomonadota bacterium]
MNETLFSNGMGHGAGRDGGASTERRFARATMLAPQRRPFARLPLAVAAAMLLLVLPARADFRVDTGDVIEIVVTSAPELQRRLPVRIDGNISFPLIGTMKVAGLTASELQDRVQAALSAKVFQRRMPDGTQVDIIIGADEVTASVVEYRPVYVNGDVLKPGEYAYRPSMTVRQAVTAAGSYSLVRFGTGDRFAETANFEAEFGALWAEYVRAEARIWGLRKLLGQEQPFDYATLVGGPITRASAREALPSKPGVGPLSKPVRRAAGMPSCRPRCWRTTRSPFSPSVRRSRTRAPPTTRRSWRALPSSTAAANSSASG